MDDQVDRKLADELAAAGHPVSDPTVARIQAQGFSLQGAKAIEGSQHADRDAQFRYLNDRGHRVPRRRAAGDLGRYEEEGTGRRAYKNGGREYQPQGSPVRVNVHDFPDKELGKAIPYGIYDVAANTGWVSVGADHDTAAFAVRDAPPLVGHRRPAPLPATPTGC